jgi:hypothetical protein
LAVIATAAVLAVAATTTRDATTSHAGNHLHLVVFDLRMSGDRHYRLTHDELEQPSHVQRNL